ncbi:hypothetical protein MCHIJ_04340 [Mycolicibacterium chitae]|nr:hypothetical protein MCHIJ_04340 [Mycolicibacterium chitae]
MLRRYRHRPAEVWNLLKVSVPHHGARVRPESALVSRSPGHIPEWWGGPARFVGTDGRAVFAAGWGRGDGE